RAEEAISRAEKAGNETLRIAATMPIALKQLGYGELHTELAEANSLLDEIIRTARSLKYKPGLCAGLTHRGTLHFFQSEYESAEQVHKEAISLATELRDGFLLLICLFFLGLSRANLGRMSEALVTLKEVMEMTRRNGDLIWLARLPNSIGWIHSELQDFDYALKHDQQGVEISRETQIVE